ncbi:type II toxin-antitoxin system RelE/ParE family toxin [candidate division CSSED10-310 bacterium]|uniref:Type II toxin-antitoxin system RelE/ParE family toxin n=1 Tax=candidate division CSSED10-310 bacterium TaxID=2855610 RepID=A0ABV6YT46_UNCC1
MKKISFLAPAEKEMNDAAKFYEDKAHGLGIDFLIEIQNALDLILENAQIAPVVEHDIRRFPIERFPYGILYSIEPKEIAIVAIMNLHRKPGYWLDRLKK